MAKDTKFVPWEFDQLYDAIREQIHELWSHKFNENVGNQFAQIGKVDLSMFIQHTIARWLMQPDGFEQFSILLDEIGLGLEKKPSNQVNDEPVDKPQDDPLHVSNVPRIKELTEHTKSKLQKGLDIF